MKYLIPAFLFLIITTCSYGQNTFPSTGNVGIGTTTPTDKIEVVGGYIKSGHVSIGTNTLSPNAFRGPGNYINIGSDQHASLVIGSNIYVTGESGSLALKIANSHGSMAGAGIVIPGNAQAFQSCIMFHTTIPGAVTADAPYSSCQMILTEHGNLGIGTTNTHDYKLAVNGSIRSKEVKVEAGPWPDYVFRPAYRLPALNEVRAYVKKTGHLPEIPSEAKVASEGINLGEMNVKLLKKVEELTLYLIEKDRQDKQKGRLLKSLQKQINKLKKSKQRQNIN